jgi:drug/metabolite transporter (DMT)-like permease
MKLAEQAPVKGIVCSIVGTLVLTSHDAVSKWLVETLHTGEIIAWRGLLAIPVVLLLVRLEGDPWSSLKSQAFGRTLLRGFLGVITSALVILSYRMMPLADALAIVFASPLIVTALSAVMLHEHVGWRRWAATFAGFGGALLIVGPSFESVGWWALAPLGAALASAFRDIVTRQLGGQDTGPSILFWTMVVSIAGGVASLPFAGVSTPTALDWGLLAVCAVTIALAYRLNIAAFKLASGAIVAPLRYLSLVWAAALGFMLWGDVPDWRTVTGSVIIMAAGLYTLHRESRLAKAG